MLAVLSLVLTCVTKRFRKFLFWEAFKDKKNTSLVVCKLHTTWVEGALILCRGSCRLNCVAEAPIAIAHASVCIQISLVLLMCTCNALDYIW